MRKPLVIIAALAAATALAVPAAASTASKKKPVKLEGKVNNEGIGRVVDGAVEIEADDFYFEKTFIKGAAGETVSVTVTNEGDVQHTFTIEAQDIDETLDAGDTITVDVELPDSGKPVTGYCRFHRGTGMQLAFFSKAGGRGTRTDGSQPTDDSQPTGGYGY